MTLAEYRAATGISITALAKQLGLPMTTVHGWFTGRRKPDLDLLESVSAATGGAVTPADLRPDLASLLRLKAPQRLTPPAPMPRRRRAAKPEAAA